MSDYDARTRKRPPTAVVMHLFYTGLGIARSLGERGVQVIGLTTEPHVFGNFSRYVRTVRCADSRNDPEALLAQFIELGQTLGGRSVLFPTRDHDLLFLDRYRAELEPYFIPVIPGARALARCLNKWETHEAAVRANVPSPMSWLIESVEDLHKAIDRIPFPCVLKPLEAHSWRAGANWEIVGARKAIGIASPEELLAEYATIARADSRVLLQEMIPGGDDCLIIAACYFDRELNFRGGFNTQKVLQTPPGFGTGCIVQSADRPELFERTIRLLREIQFSGIAEVEYKWDASAGDFKLIEINPRPWDQHRLGSACGVDLIYLAYCDLAGLSSPDARVRFTAQKWLAEHDFLMDALRLLWRRRGGLRAFLRQARGKRMYAIWSVRDPLPFFAYLWQLVPALWRMAIEAIRRLLSAETTVLPKTETGTGTLK